MANVLIIEDEEYYGEFLKRIIGKKHSCDWARDSREAKDFLDRNPYDIVLYDLRLPGTSGRELIRYVKETVDPATVNIIITGYEDDWPAVEATEEHVFFYLRKGNFKPEELLKVLGSAAELRRLRRSEVDYVRNLVSAEKLASAGKLAMSIAHEINNPLQGMMSIMEVLKEKAAILEARDRAAAAVAGHRVEGSAPQNPNSFEHDLDILNRSIERIRKVVKQLIDLHDTDYSEDQKISLGDVVERVVSFIRPIARERNTKLAVQRTNAGNSVNVSEKQFFHVLLNTLMNLLDGNYETINVKTGMRGDQAILSIAATARELGEARRAEPRALQPGGFQGPSPGRASGLEISKSIIESLHGSLDFKRKERGDTLTITLPSPGK